MPASKPAKMRRHRNSRFLARVALAACTCIAAVDAGNRIVFDSLRPIVTTRLDPIVFPGAISQHIHRVVGGNNFNSIYDPQVYRNSTCSSMAPQADMSNYWHPTLYKVILQPDGSSKYSPMWGQTRIYYNFPQLKKGTGPGTYVEPFPENFEMVAGSPSKKTGGGYSQEDLSIFYYCERDYKNGTVVGYSTYDLPKFGCSFITTKVWFPTCWNGQAYDPTNPYAHVKYPMIGGGLLGANCPVGYERRIPGILVETFYFGYGTNGWMQWYQGPGDEFGGNADLAPTYILANGDTTGYGLHADFANGWNQTVLQQVVTQCLDTNFDLRADKACPPLAPSWNQTAANNCHLSTNTQIPNEPVGWDGALDALPGCNLPWASGTKPTCAGYKERRWTNWGRLIGPELNEEPTLADLANDPFGLNATTSTIVTSNAPTSAVTSTSLSLDTNQTTLTMPTTFISVPTTTIISNASPTLITDTGIITTTGVASDIPTTTTDVSLTRGEDGTTIIDSSSAASSSSTALDSTGPGTTDAASTSGLPSTSVQSSTSLQPSTSLQTSTSLQSSTSLVGPSSSSIATTSKVATTSKAATTTSQTATTTSKAATTTSKAATTTSKAATTTSKVATTTSKVTTTSKAATTSKASTTSKAATTSKATTTSKPATTTTKAATTTSKPATTTSKPATTTSKAATSTSKAATTTSKAATTTSKAATTTSKVATTTSQAATTTSNIAMTTSSSLSTSSQSSISSSSNMPSSSSVAVSSSVVPASSGSTTSASLPATSTSSTPPIFVSTTSSKIGLASGRRPATTTSKVSTTPKASSTSSRASTSSKASTSSSQPASAPATSSTANSSSKSTVSSAPPTSSSPASTTASSDSVPLFSSTSVGLALGRGRALKQSPTTSASLASSLVHRDTTTSPAFSSLTSNFEDEHSTSSVKLAPIRFRASA